MRSSPAVDRLDPIALLESQGAQRVPARRARPTGAVCTAPVGGMDMEPCALHAQQRDWPTSTGQSPGVQSGGLGLRRSTPVSSSPGSDHSAAEDCDSISAIAAPGADGRTAPVPTFSPTASVESDAVSLAGDLPTERHRLPARVTRYWRWRAFYASLPLLVLLISVAIVLPWGPWWVRWGIVGVVVVVIAAGISILPPIRFRVFWYAISSTEIDIQDGIIFITRSVVPMRRVQTLLTERGPMADHYRLTNLKIRTAAGSVRLGGLDRGEADDLCERIGRLTDLADDV
jgi:membrane protein YdbS with pleckstrin-like domain